MSYWKVLMLFFLYAFFLFIELKLVFLKKKNLKLDF